jgi:hypothetical protein
VEAAVSRTVENTETSSSNARFQNFSAVKFNHGVCNSEEGITLKLRKCTHTITKNLLHIVITAIATVHTGESTHGITQYARELSIRSAIRNGK